MPIFFLQWGGWHPLPIRSRIALVWLINKFLWNSGIVQSLIDCSRIQKNSFPNDVSLLIISFSHVLGGHWIKTIHSDSLLFICRFIKWSSYTSHAGLGFSTYLKIILNFRSSSFHLQVTGIMGLWHKTWWYVGFWTETQRSQFGKIHLHHFYLCLLENIPHVIAWCTFMKKF